MSANGYAAYKTAQTNKDDPRDIEYRLLAQVTGSLIKAKEEKSILRDRLEAIMWNRDVWSALRQDLMMPDNHLPKELRASLISISLWVENETRTMMGGEDGDVDALIEINRNIMLGLKPDLADAAP